MLLELYMGVPKIGGTDFRGPHTKEYSILVVYFRVPLFREATIICYWWPLRTILPQVSAAAGPPSYQTGLCLLSRRQVALLSLIMSSTTVAGFLLSKAFFPTTS